MSSRDLSLSRYRGNRDVRAQFGAGCSGGHIRCEDGHFLSNPVINGETALELHQPVVTTENFAGLTTSSRTFETGADRPRGRTPPGSRETDGAGPVELLSYCFARAGGGRGYVRQMPSQSVLRELGTRGRCSCPWSSSGVPPTLLQS